MNLGDPAHKVNSSAPPAEAGDAAAPRWMTRRGLRATGDGNFDPAKNQWAEAIVAVNKDGTLKDYFAPSNALWLWKMDLDMQVTPDALRLQGPQAAGHVEQGVPHLPAGPRNLGGADHRTPLFRTTGCAMKRSTSRRPACGAAWRLGKMRRARAGC